MHREHRFGLTKARKIAWQWAEQVERDFDMQCTVIEGPQRDTVEFTRSGVSGTLVVAADHFDLHARLGLLLGLFTEKIEAEIEKTLETLLVKATPAKPRPSAKKAAKTAAPRRK
jgi:putative polyhydroxyalkanoate system protein